MDLITKQNLSNRLLKKNRHMKKLLLYFLFVTSASIQAQDTIRGRGSKQNVVLKTDADGIPIYRLVTGVDYYKASINETFEISKGVAHWKSNSEQGEKTLTDKALYSPINSTPAEIEWMLHAALLSKDHKIDMLPSGFLQAKHIVSHTLKLNGFNEELELYSFIGSGGPPAHAWFTPKKKFFAAVNSWGGVVMKDYEGTVDELYEAQKSAEQKYFELQSLQLTEIMKVPVVFKGVTIFNTITGKNVKNQTVIVENGNFPNSGNLSV